MRGSIVVYNQRVPAAGPRSTPGPAIAQPGLDLRQNAQTQLVHDLTGSGVAGMQIAARQVAEQGRVRLATDVMEAATEYEAEARAFENDYYEKNKGAAARDAGLAFKDWHTKNGRKYAERFKDDAEASLLFARSAKQSAASSIQRGFDYGRQQDEVYRTDTLNARKADLFAFAASTDDAAAIDKRRATYAEEAKTLMPGRDMTAHLADVDREMTGNAIRARLVAGDVAGAQAMLEERRALLGPSYDEVAAQVQAEADNYFVAQKSAEISERYKTNIAGALNEIRATVKDPTLRGRIERDVKAEFTLSESLRERAEKEARTARLDAAVRDLQGAATPKERFEIIRRLPLEEQALASTYMERMASSFPTDPVKYIEAKDKIHAGEPVSLEAEYGPYINPQGIAELKALAGSEERRKAEKVSDEIIASAIARVGIKTDTAEGKRAVAQIRLDYEKRKATTGATTFEAMSKLAFDVTVARIEEDGGWFWFDKERSAVERRYGVENSEVTGPEYYKVPDEARKVIVKRLIRDGLPATDAAISRWYFTNREAFGW